MFGFVFAPLAPLINLQLVVMIDEFYTDEEVNDHVLRQLKSNPSILCTSLYLSSSAVRAILNAEVGPDAPAILAQCGVSVPCARCEPAMPLLR